LWRVLWFPVTAALFVLLPALVLTYLVALAIIGLVFWFTTLGDEDILFMLEEVANFNFRAAMRQWAARLGGKHADEGTD